MIAERKKYSVTQHAIKRTGERLGIGAEHAEHHLNNLMQSAYFQGVVPSKQGRARVYDHHKSNTRLILCEAGKRIITVYKMPEGLDVSGLMLDFLRPTLEREMRKLKRLYTRKVRAYELKHAEALRELSEMTFNRARARNPNTRDLISERIAIKQDEVKTLVADIKRFGDEYETKKKAIEVISE